VCPRLATPRRPPHPGLSAPRPGKDLIRKLLRIDPNERLTAEETLRHPWLFEGLPDEDPALAAVKRAETQVVSSGAAQRTSPRKRGRKPAEADRVDPEHEE